MKKAILFIFLAILSIFIIVEIILNLTKPQVVDHFACSDYCPGPAEKYTIQIYKGVKNSTYCWAIFGKPKTYFGWGQFTVCQVR